MKNLILLTFLYLNFNFSLAQELTIADIIGPHAYFGSIQNQFNLRPERYNDIVLSCYDQHGPFGSINQSSGQINKILALAQSFKQLMELENRWEQNLGRNGTRPMPVWPPICRELYNIAEDITPEYQTRFPRLTDVYLERMTEENNYQLNSVTADRFLDTSLLVQYDEQDIHNVLAFVRRTNGRRPITDTDKEKLAAIIERMQREFNQMQERGAAEDYLRTLRSRLPSHLRSSLNNTASFSSALSSQLQNLQNANYRGDQLVNLVRNLRNIAAVRADYIFENLSEASLLRDSNSNMHANRGHCLNLRKNQYLRHMEESSNNFCSQGCRYDSPDSIIPLYEGDTILPSDSCHSKQEYPNINFCSYPITNYSEWRNEIGKITLALRDELRNCVQTTAEYASTLNLNTDSIGSAPNQHQNPAVDNSERTMQETNDSSGSSTIPPASNYRASPY